MPVTELGHAPKTRHNEDLCQGEVFLGDGVKILSQDDPCLQKPIWM